MRRHPTPECTERSLRESFRTVCKIFATREMLLKLLGSSGARNLLQIVSVKTIKTTRSRSRFPHHPGLCYQMKSSCSPTGPRPGPGRHRLGVSGRGSYHLPDGRWALYNVRSLAGSQLGGWLYSTLIAWRLKVIGDDQDASSSQACFDAAGLFSTSTLNYVCMATIAQRSGSAALPCELVDKSGTLGNLSAETGSSQNLPEILR